jgi:hypothetical protein
LENQPLVSEVNHSGSATRGSKRIVSGTRKAGMVPVSFRMAPAELAALDALCQTRHFSRTHLIELAVRRCMAEGRWFPACDGSGSADPSPDNALVQLSSARLMLLSALRMFDQTQESWQLLEADDLMWFANTEIEANSAAPGLERLVSILRSAFGTMRWVARRGTADGDVQRAHEKLALAGRIIARHGPCS